MNAFRLNLIEQGRAAEWLTSTCLLAFAFSLMMPGNTLGGASYRAFTGVGLDEVIVAVPLALIGAARMAALYINGRWHRSPVLRMVGAIIGSSIFAMLCVAFLGPAIVYGAPVSTGVGVYLVLALFDGLAAYRSGADVRVARPN